MMNRHVLILAASLFLLETGRASAAGDAPYAVNDKGTAGVEIVAIDVDAGTVALRRWVRRGSLKHGLGHAFESVVAKDGTLDVVTMCERAACTPSLELIAQERERFAAVRQTAGAFSLSINRGYSNAQEPPVAGTHAGKRIVLAVNVQEPDSGPAAVTVTVDGDVRFAFPVAWHVMMAGSPHAWARLVCSDSRCMVVAGYENTDMRGGSSGSSVSAPFVLADPAPSIPAELCAGRRLLSLVASASVVSTSGERLAAALRKAGCLVRGPNPARAVRLGTVIYARTVDDPAALSIARALHAEIAPLSWESPSEIVIALGGG
jgi:hypothetical protein